ncbi:hypothetical protein [Buchananella felis]|uniref:hypothetical protein n=1 Tax=Buchananella felis TaxID=3231492 RepID=UPI0035278360
MDPNTIAAIVAAVGAVAASIAAFVALLPAQRAAKAAEEQTEVQRALMHQAAQPYVWADIQPDNQQGAMLHLVLGNAGPTVARNIRVVVDPPIPEHPNYAGRCDVAQQRLREGILSLAPGRTIRWSLGRASDLLEDPDDKTVYRIRVTAEGPYGEIEPCETEVRLSDWREARDAPDGSLHFIRTEIEKLTKVLESLKTTIGKK